MVDEQDGTGTATPSLVNGDHADTGDQDVAADSTEGILRMAAARAAERRQTHAANSGEGAVDEELDNTDFVIADDGSFKLVPQQQRAARRVSINDAPQTTGAKPADVPQSKGAPQPAPAVVDRRRGHLDASQLRDFGRKKQGYVKGMPIAPWRVQFYNAQRSRPFRFVILGAVMASAYFLASEYPANASKKEAYAIAEMGLNSIFTIEFIVKLIGLGKTYFRSAWNLLDLVVVVNGWGIVIIERMFTDRFVGSLKMLRMLRVVRPLRAISIIPSLRAIVNAVAHAVRDLGSTMLIITCA